MCDRDVVIGVDEYNTVEEEDIKPTTTDQQMHPTPDEAELSYPLATPGQFVPPPSVRHLLPSCM